MSRIIKITPDCIGEMKKEFEESLKKMKLSDGKFTFQKSFGNLPDKATLRFTEKAYIKMLSLVKHYDSEVAWHGIANRAEDEENTYVVSDILVYPQEVAAATVNTDQEKYQTWLMEQEDEVFNNIRMQGHSHVNMGTTPSGVDEAFYEQILDQLTDDMFYIFLIWNKRNDRTIKIYDMKKNILFEDKDIDVEVVQENDGIFSFLKESEEFVQERTVVAEQPKETKKADNSSGNLTVDKRTRSSIKYPTYPYYGEDDGWDEDFDYRYLGNLGKKKGKRGKYNY